MTYIINTYGPNITYKDLIFPIFENIFKVGNLHAVKLLFETKIIQLTSYIKNKAIIESSTYGHIKVFKYLITYENVKNV